MERSTEGDHPPAPLTKHSLGLVIETARERQGLTVEQLAGRVGVTSSTLRRYEIGRNMPPFDSMVRIAHQLGLPMRMFDSGDPLEEGELIAQPVARDPVIADLHTFMRDLTEAARRHHKLLTDIRRVSVMVSHQVADMDARLEHLEALAKSRSTGRGQGRSGGPAATSTHDRPKGHRGPPEEHTQVEARKAAATG